jgi:CheY-like chemotaxis protein
MKKLSLILLVDDDGISNHLNKMLIDDLEIADEIKVAYDGEEALDVIEAYYKGKAIDHNEVLVLMDVNMPGMDAFDFLNIFSNRQSRFKNLHVVLFSSSMNLKDKERSMQYQVLDYLVKPLTEEKVLKLVEEILAKQLT